MNLKKCLTALMLLLMVTFSVPAISGPITGEPVTNSDAARSQQLLQRLHEIKDMDKENLTSSEKKELRMEVKHIKKEMKVLGKGIYLSVGAIIIIILLLILLL